MRTLQDARPLPRWLAPLTVAALVALSFASAIWGDFIFLDDARMVTKNAFVRDGLTFSGIRWALTSTWGGNWMPLTWITHQLDWTLFGDDPRGHHATSVAWHAASVAMFVAALRRVRLDDRAAIVAALLFGLHPLRAESVAWVAERKDVLSTFFFVATVWAFARARAAGKVIDALVVAAFAAALMSKTMVVTLPASLVLIEWWRAGRFPPRSVLIRLTPLLLMAFGVALTTVVAQHGTAAVGHLSILHRLSGAVVAVATYVQLTVWPFGLSVFHPAQVDGVGFGRAITALALLVGISIGAIIAWRRGACAPLLSWLGFLMTLGPVVGIVPLGAHAFADRYTHLPHTWLAFGAGVMFASWSARTAAANVVVIALLVASTARLQDVLATWRDGRSLAQAGLLSNPDNPMLLGVMADMLRREGNIGAALERAEHAVAARRVFFEPEGVDQGYAQLGIVHLEGGRLEPALRYLGRAAALNPNNGIARRAHAIALFRSGDRLAGLAEARASVAVAPDDVTNRRNLSQLLVAAGEVDEASDALVRAPSHMHRDLAADRLRLEHVRGPGACARVAARAAELAPSIDVSMPGPFLAEYAMALACLNDPRTEVLLQRVVATSPSRPGALAMIIVGLRDGAPVEPLVDIYERSAVLPGLEASLRPAVEKGLSTVIAVADGRTDDREVP